MKKKQTMNEVVTNAAMLAAYFTPGNIVPSYCGYDKVMSFTPAPDGSKNPACDWVVTVVECDKDGNVKGHPRKHATLPTMRNYLRVVGNSELV